MKIGKMAHFGIKVWYCSFQSSIINKSAMVMKKIKILLSVKEKVGSGSETLTLGDAAH